MQVLLNPVAFSINLHILTPPNQTNTVTCAQIEDDVSLLPASPPLAAVTIDLTAEPHGEPDGSPPKEKSLEEFIKWQDKFEGQKSLPREEQVVISQIIGNPDLK